jgi:hypothetical protein
VIPLAERPGVREDQRSIEAEDDESRHERRLGVDDRVAQTRQTVDPSQGRLVGPPRPEEHVAYRQHDRDGDAGQDPQQGDAQERRDREGTFDPSLSPQAHDTGDV